jgi:hypothetical protein
MSLFKWPVLAADEADVSTQFLSSRPRAGFMWVLAAFVVSAVVFGAVVFQRHSDDVTRSRVAEVAQQRLTAYRAPTGIEDIARTFGCFGSVGQRCFTSVLDPEAAANRLVPSLTAVSPVTCKLTAQGFKVCDITGLMASTKVMAIVSDWRLSQTPEERAAQPAGGPASAITLALVAS